MKAANDTLIDHAGDNNRSRKGAAQLKGYISTTTGRASRAITAPERGRHN